MMIITSRILTIIILSLLALLTWFGTGISATWTQIGSDIDGKGAYNYSGYSVSLSADGSIVAIVAPGVSGTTISYVRIFKWNGLGWIQIGDDIHGEEIYDYLMSVSLSADGSIVAVGAPLNDDNGNNSGHVRVYKYEAGDWTQLGSDIDGEAIDDQSGWSVSLSADGTIVAIGAPYNAGTGHVRIYKYEAGTWTQLGSDIDGETVFDKSGWSVSLSSDGSIIAIGAPSNDGTYTDFYDYDSGHVRVYKFEGGTWTQVGSDIDGKSFDDFSGYSVSLSADGSIVAVGATEYFDPGVYGDGYVIIYTWDGSIWSQTGHAINGESGSDSSGFSVGLNADGSIIAIGAIGSSDYDLAAGHVRIFRKTNYSKSSFPWWSFVPAIMKAAQDKNQQQQ